VAGESCFARRSFRGSHSFSDGYSEGGVNEEKKSRINKEAILFTINNSRCFLISCNAVISSAKAIAAGKVMDTESNSERSTITSATKEIPLQ
jgi:hypothetical protein